MDKTRLLAMALSLGLFLAVVACESLFPDNIEPEKLLGEPILALAPEQQQSHAKGDTEFGRVFGVVDGLGPIFVSTSCESCHIGDGKGHPTTSLTRFNRQDGLDFDPMISVGASQLQHRAITGYTPETLPIDIKGSTRLTPPAVGGLGYLAAVPDADILAMADPHDLNGDGISGVPNYFPAPDFFEPEKFHLPDAAGRYIGRFGKKAGAIDLLQQVANAYLLDMGITSEFLRTDLYNEQLGNHTGDNIPDPEVPGSVVRNVVLYMRTLKVPPRRNARQPEVLAGEQLFIQLGCAKCHVPTLKTGLSDIAALSNQTFHPYTDLLLHDMGPELDDNYTEGSARTSEWRTAPLWGLGLAAEAQGRQVFYLHDGRARTLEEAIQFHGGEAAGSRIKFTALPSPNQKELVAFLQSL
ncbi:hypothetical protein AAE02nite_31410 [Adhaeribacter aerolatus]|uniref:Cytochrome c domain-containing protein n=1 Tax=Adhaeribacter aerolatus TaxID=670289 RepID=A0A512B112_9BACT|nr:di-heme oxidoredictase family protein [Adhaeribacter aerolatus]GEO05477.1 hypothetical protein AAE02nite_31410 [Adhaeribacter aerolatus]